MNPGVKWLEAVSKRASLEGWKVRLTGESFQWSKDNKEESIIMTPSFSIKEALFFSCVWLDEHLGWKTSVVIE